MPLSATVSREEQRLKEDRERSKYWRKWGTYMCERSWGVPREDYTDNGDSWQFGFDMSRSRAFRWTEQGMAGVCDDHQFQCMSLALWNGKDPFLKDTLFGLPGGASAQSGNHGEDVKELYYFLDNTPTHSYAKCLYKYPINEFPYEEIRKGNSSRTKSDPEFEITDTDAFKNNKYFDVFFEMAKDTTNTEQINFRVTAYNRSKEPAPISIIPQLFFRNTWAWNLEEYRDCPKPKLSKSSDTSIISDHWKLGKYHFIFPPAPGVSENDPDVIPQFAFCDNDTNFQKLYHVKNKTSYCKDGFHEYFVNHDDKAINPDNFGTKACACYKFDGVLPGDYVTVRYEMTNNMAEEEEYLDENFFDSIFDERIEEADEFYWNVTPLPLPFTLRNIQRQAFSGLLWSKQFYHFIHDYWYKGDPNSELPPTQGRANGRNKEWKNLYNRDILSMPDSFEYPFYCSWDTAFHTIPLAMIDPDFAKKQLDLLTREWYMSPQGQIPAYEWNFSDTNPPVQAWAAYRVYKIEKRMYGHADRMFLERIFQKFLINFTWWVNRKDVDGNGIFEGGFLGLDNISLFNRSEPPANIELLQSDASGWIAWYSLVMMNIALELAKDDPVYEDIASKFFEHFLLIADAMTFLNKQKGEDDGKPSEESLWNEEDKFFYDRICWDGNHTTPMKVRSLVGLIPLFATSTLEPKVLKRFPKFRKRLEWLGKNKRYLVKRHISLMEVKGVGDRLLLSLVNKERLVSILGKLFDSEEFLSDYGIRSLSKYHAKHPVSMTIHNQEFSVSYLPGESDSGMFGGNSNWRGPIWFPINFLLIESLLRFYLFYGSTLKVEVPTGSKEMLNLGQAAEEIQQRLIHLFVPDKKGYRAYNGQRAEEKTDFDKRHNEMLDMMNTDDHFKNLLNFYEYFDGDTGRGLGAKWQCGWTALVARMIQDVGVICRAPRTPVRRKSCYSEDEIHSYEPKSSPFCFLNRRKSGKSLYHLTAHKLEMGEEEARSHFPPGITRQTSVKSTGSVQTGSTFDSEASMHEDFLKQVRDAMANFKISPDEVNISSDEFETHVSD